MTAGSKTAYSTRMQVMPIRQQLIQQTWPLIKPYFASSEKRLACLTLLAAILCTIISVYSSLALTNFYREFYDALQTYDRPAIWRAIFHFILIFAAWMLSYGYQFYFSNILSIRWRKWLTQQVITQWLAAPHLFDTVASTKIDNIDQRISEDLNEFPEQTIAVFFLLLNASLTLMIFGSALWSLSSTLTFQIASIRFHFPHYAFWTAICYGAIAACMTAWLGHQLSSLTYQQQRYDADFRFQLMRTQQRATEIKLSNEMNEEAANFKQLFQPIFLNSLSVLQIKKRLSFFSGGYSTSTYICGLLLSLPLFLNHGISLGGLMQLSSAFSAVSGAFTSLIFSYPLIKSWQAITQRTAELTMHELCFT